MSFRSTLGRGIAATLFLAGVCLGQGTLGVEPGVLTAGGEATITYSNPTRAGESVKVLIDDGGLLETQYDSVTIQLDEQGNGKGKWDVPLGWTSAYFNAPEASTIRRAILESSEDDTLE